MKNINFEKVTRKLHGNRPISKDISSNVTFWGGNDHAVLNTLLKLSESYAQAEKFHQVTARLHRNPLSLLVFLKNVTCNFSKPLKRYTPYKKENILRISFTGERLAHTRLCLFLVTKLQGYISNSTSRFQSETCCNFSVTFSKRKVTPSIRTLNPIFHGVLV